MVQNCAIDDLRRDVKAQLRVERREHRAAAGTTDFRRLRSALPKYEDLITGLDRVDLGVRPHEHDLLTGTEACQPRHDLDVVSAVLRVGRGYEALNDGLRRH